MTRFRASDLVLALGVVLSIAMMIVPVPLALLDGLLSLNLAVSALLLMVALYLRDAMAMATLPTVLVLTTLFRLGLEVAAARAILSRADAGSVIRAFGRLVVQGNLVVGAVVFAVLTVVQYLVIARGGERVAEVAARFALDALPGRQMAIDAELRTGALTGVQARAARIALARESAFCGAMDGAMKFVKGDAIAGIVIVAVNLVGGVGIGVWQRHLSAADALQRFGLLTIGQGLVAQIPALLVASTAALVVTRIGGDARHPSLGGAIASQLGVHPMPLAIAAGLMALLACVPGLPVAPFAVLALAAGGGAALLGRRAPEETSELVLWTSRRIDTDLLRAKIDARCTPWGVRVPSIVVRARAEEGWLLTLRGTTLARGTEDPVDAIEAHRAEFLGVEETQTSVDALAETHAALVRAVVPRVVEIPVLAAVLRRLVEERVSVANVRDVFEALALRNESTHDIESLVATARQGARRVITQEAMDGGRVRAWRLSGEASAMLRSAVRGGALRVDPALADELQRDLQAKAGTDRVVLIADADIRRHAWAVFAPVLTHGVVISPDELLDATSVEVLGVIGPV